MDTIVCLTLLGCLGFVASLPLNVTAAVKPPCICTMQYDPVCGSDGVTYGNKCALDCTGVNMTNKGECRHLCACPRIYKPVCGQDGKTYSNRCVLDCTGFAIFREGPCSTVAADVLCICTFIYQPVCGVDGVTYGNDCNRKCQSCETSSYNLNYDRYRNLIPSGIYLSVLPKDNTTVVLVGPNEQSIGIGYAVDILCVTHRGGFTIGVVVFYIELSHTGPCTGNEKITPMPPTTKAAAVTTTLGGPIPMAPLDLD